VADIQTIRQMDLDRRVGDLFPGGEPALAAAVAVAFWSCSPMCHRVTHRNLKWHSGFDAPRESARWRPGGSSPALFPASSRPAQFRHGDRYGGREEGSRSPFHQMQLRRSATSWPRAKPTACPASSSNAVQVSLDDITGRGAMLAQALRETGGDLTPAERSWASDVLGLRSSA